MPPVFAGHRVSRAAVFALGDLHMRGSARNNAPGFVCRGHVDTWMVNFHGECMVPGFQIPLNRMAHIDPVTGITVLSIIVKVVIVNTAGRQVPS